MSELLGRRDCIESLRKDLVDLQGAILEVFSRTGPVRFPSWKFPDKLSCHLDMLALMERYDFIDGEDTFNQHSHIVLLELVIDRLLLLLQSFSSYAVQLRSSSRREQNQQKGCMSVGLVARSCWSNLVEFAKMKESCRDIGDLTRSKMIHSDETQTTTPIYLQGSSRTDLCRRALSASSLPPGLTHNPAGSVLVHRHNVSCQTIQSSLTPCDACHQVQSTLRRTGAALVGLFDSEGLPSSLQPLLVAVEDTLEPGHMTAADVAQWGNEQLRDMRRLSKHLGDVRGTVQPLQERLAAAETERERLRSQLAQTQKEFKQELDKHQANSVQLEFSLRKAERAVKETEKRLQDEQQQLQREIMTLEETNSRLKEQVASQQDNLQVLEHDKSVLQEKVKTLQIEEEERCKLRQRIQQLECETSDIQLLLDKETAKYQTACQQKESMQAKQRSLDERVDTLNEKCEDLQRELLEREKLEADFHNQLHQVTHEKEKLQTQFTQHEELCLEAHREKRTLELQVGELKHSVAELKEHIRSLREREKLLVAFPDLTPLAHAQPQTTGNVVLDMKQQLQANSIRIEVLDQENVTLQQSLFKLKERARQNATRVGHFQCSKNV
ncbi:coiled-coil domain-containing protein 157 [Salarias fasciatus]|nr:coiled-coil domain-containing protein 157 [Salarias fasciatus]